MARTLPPVFGPWLFLIGFDMTVADATNPDDAELLASILVSPLETYPEPIQDPVDMGVIDHDLH